MSASNGFVKKVLRCARCGEDHDEVDFMRFSKHPVEDNDGTVWQYWGICPLSGEPILMTTDPNYEPKTYAGHVDTLADLAKVQKKVVWDKDRFKEFGDDIP